MIGTEIPISTNGEISAKLVDNEGNEGAETKETITNIDKTEPTVSISAEEILYNSIKVQVTASDEESGLATRETYKYYLGDELKETTTTSSYTFEGLKGKTSYAIKVIVIDNAGNESDDSVTVETPERPITADEIANMEDKSELYGKIVKGYECDRNNEIEEWKILCADETNIYIIGCTTSNVTVDWSEVDSYSGSQDISSPDLQNLNQRWYDILSATGQVSTSNCAKFTAYLMDTSVWDGFAGSAADFAIGGPSLELVEKSLGYSEGEWLTVSVTRLRFELYG